mgnify:CR=1 FL=1
MGTNGTRAQAHRGGGYFLPFPPLCCFAQVLLFNTEATVKFYGVFLVLTLLLGLPLVFQLFIFLLQPLSTLHNIFFPFFFV